MLYRYEYVAGKRMTFMGQQYEPGEAVPASALADVPANRLESMKRTRYLVEKVTAVPEEGDAPLIVAVDEPTPEGICPQCGEGPFSRIARHIAAKHESIEELESADGN